MRILYKCFISSICLYRFLVCHFSHSASCILLARRTCTISTRGLEIPELSAYLERQGFPLSGPLPAHVCITNQYRGKCNAANYHLCFCLTSLSFKMKCEVASRAVMQAPHTHTNTHTRTHVHTHCSLQAAGLLRLAFDFLPRRPCRRSGDVTEHATLPRRCFHRQTRV